MDIGRGSTGVVFIDPQNCPGNVVGAS